MARALIAFASTYGHTETIARRIAAILVESGMSADVAKIPRLGRVPRAAGYDLVVVAGSIYFGRHHARLRRFIRINRAALDAGDNALVSVSGSAIDADGRPDAEQYVRELTEKTGWTPRRVLLAGGATTYTRYGYFLKRTVRKASETSGRGTDITRDYDYTNWAEVEAFARALLRSGRVVG